jgi:hypothetical protein
MSAAGFLLTEPSRGYTTQQTQFTGVFEGSLNRAFRQASIIQLGGALRGQEICLRLTRNETDYEIELARWCDLRLQLAREMQ